jgi:UDP-N-acetylglucosamine 1-carboxyvinyltransferase
MAAIQYIVEGGHRLSGNIRPAGNKNAALPIVAAALLTDQPVQLTNVPRIRDIETLVELIRTTGAECEWTGPNALHMHARTVHAADLDPTMCARIRASILLAARCWHGAASAPPGGRRDQPTSARRTSMQALSRSRLGAFRTTGDCSATSSSMNRA